jgi:SAM-dependent methyltransferase
MPFAKICVYSRINAYGVRNISSQLEIAHCKGDALAATRNQMNEITPATQHSREVQAAYDAVADRYADQFFNELQHKPFDCKMLDWLIERCGSGLIGDIGCGPGQVARYLRDRGAAVQGIDLSPAMIAEAQARNPDIPFAQGDMLALADVPAGSFAGLAAFYAIVNFSKDDLARAFAELHRVLQPGGWLLLSFHEGDETRHLDEFLERHVMLDFTFFTAADVKAALASAGFKVAELLLRDAYAGVEYPSRRAYVFAQSQ